MRKRERVTGRALGWKQSITEHLKTFKVGKLSKVCKRKKVFPPLLDGSTLSVLGRLWVEKMLGELHSVLLRRRFQHLPSL